MHSMDSFSRFKEQAPTEDVENFAQFLTMTPPFSSRSNVDVSDRYDDIGRVVSKAKTMPPIVLRSVIAGFFQSVFRKAQRNVDSGKVTSLTSSPVRNPRQTNTVTQPLKREVEQETF